MPCRQDPQKASFINRKSCKMANFIFISPNFPDNYWHFCARLRENGLNVLGIGDCPYDDLRPELKSALTEYYKVSTLESYDEVYRACAFFAFKYGRIDWLESNNEYWLSRDAQLRLDFNITTGLHPEDMPHVKAKSAMKDCYRAAGIPVARYHMVDDKAGCMAFIKEVGWPVIVKPDSGVGASSTYRLEKEADLDAFLAEGHTGPFIMEEFIAGEVQTFDAIIDSKGEPIFETGNVTVGSIMDVVNDADNSMFYIRGALPEDIRKAGRAAVKAFGVKSRFIHFEFFRLLKDQHIGKKGDVVALEVNLRPSGGISPDMMNYANATDVYKIWADMVAFDRTDKPVGQRKNCVFASRRKGKNFAYTNEYIREKYGAHIVEEAPVPEALSGAMADYMFLAVFENESDVYSFAADVFKQV